MTLHFAPGRRGTLAQVALLTLIGNLTLVYSCPLRAQPAADSSPPPEPTPTNSASAASSSETITTAVTVTGSGTTGRIPRWTGASTLSNSALVQSNGNIGISHTAPPSKLTVDGSDASQATIRAPVR